MASHLVSANGCLTPSQTDRQRSIRSFQLKTHWGKWSLTLISVCPTSNIFPVKCHILVKWRLSVPNCWHNQKLPYIQNHCNSYSTNEEPLISACSHPLIILPDMFSEKKPTTPHQQSKQGWVSGCCWRWWWWWLMTGFVCCHETLAAARYFGRKCSPEQASRL